VSHITAKENQRLKKDVKELRARIAAFESSRWWKLHPRFVLARVRRRSPAPVPDRPKRSRPTTETDATAERFRAEVVAHGAFSEDWFTVHIPQWEPVLRELQGRAASALELGSFEGLSACFLLWRLRDAQVTCVDTFAGIPEYAAYGISAELEGAFDRNVALVDASRVRKIVGKTHRVLSALADEQAQFDLVYVDASHHALDVLADAALAWKLLKEGGIAIFDDYGPIPSGEDALLYPTSAIDAFFGLVAGRHEVVDDRRQLIVRKTG
jgi:SAM-dependent methyltransferase